MQVKVHEILAKIPSSETYVILDNAYSRPNTQFKQDSLPLILQGNTDVPLPFLIVLYPAVGWGGGGVPQGPGQDNPDQGTPFLSVNRQTTVKTWPSLVLRTWSVMMSYYGVKFTWWRAWRVWFWSFLDRWTGWWASLCPDRKCCHLTLQTQAVWRHIRMETFPSC